MERNIPFAQKRIGDNTYPFLRAVRMRDIFKISEVA